MFGLFQYQKKQIRQPGTLHLLKVNPSASNSTTYHQEIKSNTLKNIDLEVICTNFFSPKFGFSLMT